MIIKTSKMKTICEKFLGFRWKLQMKTSRFVIFHHAIKILGWILLFTAAAKGKVSYSFTVEKWPFACRRNRHPSKPRHIPSNSRIMKVGFIMDITIVSYIIIWFWARVIKSCSFLGILLLSQEFCLPRVLLTHNK